jgi:inner membrane protein
MSDWAERVSSRLRHSQTLRLVTVGFLVLLLQIPIAMIGGQVSERKMRGEAAVEEVSSKWGRPQLLTGPVLVLPYVHVWTELAKNGQSIEREEFRYASFLPDKLEITGIATSEIRTRGIFEVPVYRLDLNVSGTFSRPDMASLGLASSQVAWERAQIVVGISDPRAIQKSSNLSWNGRAIAFSPGTGGQREIRDGVHAVIDLRENVPQMEFSFPLAINGSESVRFTPFGKLTHVSLKSNFAHPSFQGNWLPTERTVSSDGFEAQWSIPFLGRSFPQAWAGDKDLREQIERSGFGVDFIDPVDHYRMAERSVKYAGLFILLTFAALWLFEVRAGVRVHPIQFLMLGAALCLFYLLELALSEHIAFPLAFALASLSVVGMVVAYGIVVLRGLPRALAVGGGVALLYVYLYVLLVNEDYALLVGSLGLFVILALIMFATRRVDWYAVGSRSATTASDESRTP